MHEKILTFDWLSQDIHNPLLGYVHDLNINLKIFLIKIINMFIYVFHI